MSEKSEKSEKNIHQGHRKRITDEFLKNGLDGFNDIRALELLIGASGVRYDVNPVAHALLERFKTLSNIFDASVEELTDVEGISTRTAAIIKLVPAIYKKAEAEDSRKRVRSFSSAEAAAKYIGTLIGNNRDESFMLFSLDSKLHLIKYDVIQEGTVNKVNVDIRKVVETALSNKVSACIIAHNHPDGDLQPSKEDITVTDRLNDALRVVGIPLADHIIVSPEGYFSFKEKGLL